MSESNKCFYCNKKLKTLQLITNKCRCNNTYCNKHLFYKSHNCSFNYIDNFKITNSSNLHNTLELDKKIIKI